MSGEFVPKPTGDTREFWEGCREKRLRFQKCKDCGHVRWPASNLCPECHSFEFTWIDSSGRGRVHTFVVYHMAFHPGWREKLPYITAVVELDEGPRFLSNIVESDPQALSCGAPVEVIWDKAGEFFVPRFKLSI
jgi:uncharacterized OB-fold protein